MTADRVSAELKQPPRLPPIITTGGWFMMPNFSSSTIAASDSSPVTLVGAEAFDPAAAKKSIEEKGGGEGSAKTHFQEQLTTTPEPDVQPRGVIPDGGARAWLVVLGGFTNYCTTFGLLNSFGTFQTYYQTDLLAGTSPSTISWIGSVQLFLLFLGGMVVGPAFDKYGARRLSIPGTLIYVLSFMITSVAKKYYQILLCQGFLYGIGNAMLFYPTISAISHWFDRKRGLALGIVVSGSSIGGIIWPILIEKLFREIGFGWTVRTVGFIALPLLLISCGLVRERRESSHAHGGPPPTNILKGLLDAKYVIATFGFMFVYLGMFIPFYYIPTYGIAHGLDPVFANYLLAILNAGSFFGRVGSGQLADRFGRFNITFLMSTCTGIVLVCLLAMKVKATIIVFVILYGLFSGGLISLQPACVGQITSNISMIGVRIGVMMAVCSVGVLTGGPIGGALLEHNGGEWYGLILFSSITLLFGAFLLLVARLVGNRQVLAVF